jgi:hypothetical protein
MAVRVIQCPVCKNETVEEHFSPAHMKMSTGRNMKGSGGYHSESLLFRTDCSSCGATEKEIKELLEKATKSEREARLAKKREELAKLMQQHKERT